MTRSLRVIVAGVALLAATIPAGLVSAQPAESRLIVGVLDDSGTPVSGLGPGDVTLRIDGEPVAVTAMVPADDTVQVAVLFEGLAASPQLVSEAITTFSSALAADSALDVFTVSDDLPLAISDAVADLRQRNAPRPVVVLLGQANRLSQSRRGLTIATGIAGDVEGDLDALAELLVDTGTRFYGVSVTNVALDGLVGLSDASGGRFEIIASADEIIDRLTGIAQELSAQYLVTYPTGTTPAAAPELQVDRPGATVRLSRQPPVAP